MAFVRKAKRRESDDPLIHAAWARPCFPPIQSPRAPGGSGAPGRPAKTRQSRTTRQRSPMTDFIRPRDRPPWPSRGRREADFSPRACCRNAMWPGS